MKEKTLRIKVITPEFRVSFPQLFEAKKVNETDLKAKFSIQMLFQVKETEASKKEGRPVVNIEPLKEAVRAILLDKLGPKWQDEVKKTRPDGAKLYKLPFRDGTEDEKKDLDGFGEGVVFCSASSTTRPGLIDGQKNPITVPSDFYGGCYARASLNPYWYDVKGNKGVAWGLQNVQKIRDGEPFGGRANPDADFEAIAVPAGATAGAGASDPTGL